MMRVAWVTATVAYFGSSGGWLKNIVRMHADK